MAVVITHQTPRVPTRNRGKQSLLPLLPLPPLELPVCLSKIKTPSPCLGELSTVLNMACLLPRLVPALWTAGGSWSHNLPIIPHLPCFWVAIWKEEGTGLSVLTSGLLSQWVQFKTKAIKSSILLSSLPPPPRAVSRAPCSPFGTFHPYPYSQISFLLKSLQLCCQGT